MYEGIVQDLIDELAKLPGVGPKGATRIAFHLLATDSADVTRLATVLAEVKDKIKFCRTCYNVAQDDLCRICADTRRDESSICVVEEPKDVLAVERTREFRGRYHVLGGAISPIDGVGPDDLNIPSLISRCGPGSPVKEVIIAVNATVEGQATAHYITDRLKDFDLTVSRLAHGVPVGGELDYLDEGTLSAAMRQRRPF